MPTIVKAKVLKPENTLLELQTHSGSRKWIGSAAGIYGSVKCTDTDHARSVYAVNIFIKTEKSFNHVYIMSKWGIINQ